jgi:hypothetical protein
MWTYLDEYMSDFKTQYIVPVLTRRSHMKDAANCANTVTWRATVRRRVLLARMRLTVLRSMGELERQRFSGLL